MLSQRLGDGGFKAHGATSIPRALEWLSIECLPQLPEVAVSKSRVHGIERLITAGAARALGSNRIFREDTLAYFNARLDPAGSRTALIGAAKQAKRNKVFRGNTRLGLAIDGSGAGRCSAKSKVCALCRPYHDAEGKLLGHKHELAMIAAVGGAVMLPLDVEAYGQGEAELTAGIRLLQRTGRALGPRFADYVVADAKYAAVSFLREVAALGLHAVIRLKNNLPDLHGRAVARFHGRPADRRIQHDGSEVEIWDDASFQPWEGLSWPFVRVLRYRYLTADGEVVDAYWLTDYPPSAIGSEALFRLAKNRWQIENQGFNDAKNRYGMEHICHHDANALIVGWLLLLLSMVIERLYRLCFLHRGSHACTSAANLVALLWLALRPPALHDTS